MQQDITDYEYEFLRDARTEGFDFFKWQILSDQQKNMMFRVVRSVISEIYKDNTNND